MKHQPSESEEVVELTQEEIAELDDRADAVERGEYVDGDEVIRRLRTGYYAYEFTTEQEDALEESIAQIARGEFVTAKELFDELRAIHEGTCADRETL
ncbi:MAG: hypothetical protein QOE68_1950 [Thermoanaerobaculia bacterium]|jgi:predicted transcriptional regulator|nr:hypothetical protein [Thermoanaerobaculia bacterium]